ncbi:hypothetical protein [Blastococcus sp. PRF04-17]|uniref:hypothetical protein n=1 Tax=Blastococcus sp. PRF04-17 TaxID=2933797 RepID=UPI001FF68A6C|nr:hypothetical protein [Blastococcus sp. PRF04-17]UOY03378.1 hypothetical protein MVA48_08605 [Blastococcus sp. PRF04-17]
MRLRSSFLVLAFATVSCTAAVEPDPTPTDEPSADAASVTTTRPGQPLTVVADVEPAASATAMSRAVFERSPVVVAAPADDRAGTLMGASVAVGLGVPLLLVPRSGEEFAGVATELDRLRVDTVLAVGDTEGTALDADAYDVVSVAARSEALAAVTGLDLDSPKTVAQDGDAAAVAALDPDALVALRPEDAESDTERGGAEGELPPVVRADPLTGTVVLATGEAESAAALATARAAGIEVVLTGGTTDPRGSADAIDALARSGEQAVIALGAGFAAEAGLDWKAATAATGQQLPGGGQLLFPGRLIVALYGHPGTGALGVLGEQPLDAAIERARAHAAPYEPLVDATVVPAFEIIATVASSSAGADGNYSAEADPEFLRPWVEAAGEAGLYVVLDLQPGRTDFVTQAEQYRSLLELPHVGLALDPEWRLGPNEVHLTQIGSVEVEEVNQVVTWLADLTRDNALPQKLLVLHQFRLDMLPGRERVDTSRDELAVMIHADGQGNQGDKQATWRALHASAPANLAWGWKNFYDEDQPMLTPEQTIAQVDPVPDLISYQ